jgi:hypothetical protein
MHPATGAGHHFRHGRLVWRWLSERYQGALYDCQHQPQADQDDDEAKKLAHNSSGEVCLYDYLTQRREGAKGGSGKMKKLCVFATSRQKL